MFSFLDDLDGEEAADGFDVAGAALDEIARLGLIVVRTGQVLQVIVEAVAHPAGGGLGGRAGS